MRRIQYIMLCFLWIFAAGHCLLEVGHAHAEKVSGHSDRHHHHHTDQDTHDTHHSSSSDEHHENECDVSSVLLISAKWQTQGQDLVLSGINQFVSGLTKNLLEGLLYTEQVNFSKSNYANRIFQQSPIYLGLTSAPNAPPVRI